jgi:hypothetical protein
LCFYLGLLLHEIQAITASQSPIPVRSLAECCSNARASAELAVKSSWKRRGYNFRRLIARPIDRLSGARGFIACVERFHSACKMQYDYSAGFDTP